MNKKYIFLLTVIVFIAMGIEVLFITDSDLFAEDYLKLVINGREISPDVPAQLINGRVMVPVRWVSTALNATIYWHEDSKTVEINRTQALASLPEENAKLYPFKEENGHYDGFILEAGEKRKYFDWQNNNMMSWTPRILSGDIDHDGEKELIVVLIHGTGTGVHEEEVYVINSRDLSEIEVENPLDIIKEKVQTRIDKKGEDVFINITVNDRTTDIQMKEEDSGWWSDNVGFGSVNHFYLTDDSELKADVAAEVGFGVFVGDIEITYTFDGERFSAEKVEFKGYED